MTILHHHHLPRPPTTSFMVKFAASTSITESITTTLPELVRRASCGPKDNSPECEKPSHDSSLAIGLGVGIPLFFAIVTLVILHFRHVKKLKKEEEASKDIDIDNEYFDPVELKGVQHQPSTYPLNSSNEKSFYANSSTISLNPNNLMVLDNPFNQFQYNLPALSSSQKSLNNYNPYDKSAYPPSGIIYENPKCPPSAYTRSSSPVSDMTTFHTSASNSYHNNSSFSHSMRDLNITGSNMNHSSSILQNSDIGFTNNSKVSSTLSIVSSHTPTVESFDVHSHGFTAKMEHISIRSMSSSESNDDPFDGKNSERVISDFDNSELHHTVDSHNQNAGSEKNISSTSLKLDVVSSDVNKQDTGSQFSFTNDAQNKENTATKQTEQLSFENSKQEQSSKVFDESITGTVMSSKGFATSSENMKQQVPISKEKVGKPDVELKQLYQTPVANSFQNEHDEIVSPATQFGGSTEPVVLYQQEPVSVTSIPAKDNNQNTLAQKPKSQNVQSAQCQPMQNFQDSQGFNSHASNEQLPSQQSEVQQYSQEQAARDYSYRSSGSSNSSSGSSNAKNDNHNSNYQLKSKSKPIRKTSNHPLQNVQSVESIHAELQDELQFSPTLRNSGKGSHFDYRSHSNATSYYSDVPASIPNISNFSSNSNVGRSQNSRTNSPKSSKPVPPLTELKALPTPHMLNDSVSTIEYTSQRRNTSSSKSSSPSLPAYNPVTSPLSSVSFEEKSDLPSPSQLRQSVVMFTSNDFSVPKKFGNQSRSRSNSLRSEDGNFQTAKQRPSPELVPDMKSQMEKLRPQMNMSMR